MMLYICSKFHEEIFKGFKFIEQSGNITIWTVTFVTLIFIRQGSGMSSANHLSMVKIDQSLTNILQSAQEIWSRHEKVMNRWMDGQMNRQTDRQHQDIILPIFWQAYKKNPSVGEGDYGVNTTSLYETKGNNYIRTESRIMIFFLYTHHLIMPYICTKFHEKKLF